eukprot:TRINITY_DN1315_c0_g1_i1.p1 TRINITY_DN1315_c0_g1~~TRINITY_DN1315_c0_g1_i1.p1  ORF type:complete len:559 (+),score=121.34 TRINITY_DN1315_c0_g1_i1:43-1719(+)
MPPARVEGEAAAAPAPSPSVRPAAASASGGTNTPASTAATPGNQPSNPKLFSPQWQPSPNAWQPRKSPALQGKTPAAGIIREQRSTPREATLEPRLIPRGNGRSLDVVVIAGAGLVTPWPAGRGRPGTTQDRVLLRPPPAAPAWAKRPSTGAGSSPQQRPQKGKPSASIMREISTWERKVKKAEAGDKEAQRSPAVAAVDKTPASQPVGSPSPSLEPVAGAADESVLVPSGPIAMESLLACPIEQVFEEFPRFLEEVRRQHPSTRMNLVLDWSLDEKPERLLCTLFNCYSRGVFDVRKRPGAARAPPPTPPNQPRQTPTSSPINTSTAAPAARPGSAKSAKNRPFDPAAALFTPPGGFKKPGSLDPGAKEFRPQFKKGETPQDKPQRTPLMKMRSGETPQDKPQRTPLMKMRSGETPQDKPQRTPLMGVRTPSSLSAAAPEWTPTMRPTPSSSRLNPTASEWTPNSMKPVPNSARMRNKDTPASHVPATPDDGDDLGFEPLPAGPATFAAGKSGGNAHHDGPGFEPLPAGPATFAAGKLHGHHEGSSFTLYDNPPRED